MKDNSSSIAFFVVLFIIVMSIWQGVQDTAHYQYDAEGNYIEGETK